MSSERRLPTWPRYLLVAVLCAVGAVYGWRATIPAYTWEERLVVSDRAAGSFTYAWGFSSEGSFVRSSERSWFAPGTSSGHLVERGLTVSVRHSREVHLLSRPLNPRSRHGAALGGTCSATSVARDQSGQELAAAPGCPSPATL